jgi:DNA-binding CsgD family transcriptional regulator
MALCIRTTQGKEGKAPEKLPIDRARALVEPKINSVPLNQTLLGALDRIGFGAVVLNKCGDVVSINAEGHRLLEQKMGRFGAGNEAEWLRRATRRLYTSATPWLPEETEAWVTVPCSNDRPLAMYRVVLSGVGGESGNIMMILVDFALIPQPNPATLRRIFGLTSAEARLAVKIGRGETLNKIARENNVCVATLRSQLAAIFGKTRTRRQTELAMLLARVAVLP